MTWIITNKHAVAALHNGDVAPELFPVVEDLAAAYGIGDHSFASHLVKKMMSLKMAFSIKIGAQYYNLYFLTTRINNCYSL